MMVPLNINEAFAIRVYIIMYLGGHVPDTLICINDMSHSAVTVAIALARTTVATRDIIVGCPCGACARASALSH